LAEELSAKPQGIRSIVTCCSHVQPASMMLEQVRAAVRTLQSRHADALDRGDDAPAVSREHKFLLEAFGDEQIVDPLTLL
jgi:hypothetical protein